MPFNAAAATALFSALTSHAQKLGLFDRVGQHEPVNAPGNGLSCSITLGDITPDPASSGLNMTTGRIVFQVRVWNTLMLNQSALDPVDPLVLGAVCVLLNEYGGNLTLGGLVRNIDVMGVRARAAYVADFEGKAFRVVDVTVPVVVNDMFNQVAQ